GKRVKSIKTQFLHHQAILLSTSTRFARHQLDSTWLELNKPPENPLEAKLHENNSPPRPPGNRPLLPEVSRNPIDTALVPSLFERSDDTRNPQSFLSENSHSSVSFEKSPKTSRPTFDSSHQLLVRFKRLLKLTSSLCLKIPICVLFTANESLSNPRICS
ncbi:hypothetical protein NEOLI_000650, partial [Neolecta irregularis DAH-3]